MKVIDLFSGTRAATQPWVDAGHHVIHVDIEDGHDIKALENTAAPGCVLIWASPPCTEYSTAIGRPIALKRPDLDLWRMALGFIQRSRPEYWIIENVVGAQRYWGRASCHYGAWYLWGWFPPLPSAWARSTAPTKTSREGVHTNDKVRAGRRAAIPTPLAEMIYDLIITDKTIRRIR